MSQEHLEKKIIDDIKRFSAPDPDPEFERRLHEQFIEKIELQHQTNNICKGIKWVSSFAAIVVIGILLYQGNLFNKGSNLSSQSESDFGKDQLNKQITIDVMQKDLEHNLDQKSDSIKDKVSEPELNRQKLDTTQLEEAEYIEPNRGSWRFFRDKEFRKLYAASAEDNGFLLYESKGLDILTPHIYPFPNQPNQSFVWFEEQNQSQSIHHLFLMKEDGTYVEISGIPQQGFGGYQLKWSPSGDHAILVIENYEFNEATLGEIDYSDTYSFAPLIGENKLVSNNPESVVGSSELITVSWTNNTTLFLYSKLSNSFYQYDIEHKAKPTREVPFKLLDNGQVYIQEVKPISDTPLAIIKTGERRYDVGLNETNRLYLLDMERKSFNSIEVQSKYKNVKHEQNYLGLAQNGDIIVGEIFESTSYILQIRTIDPLSLKETGVTTLSFKQPVSNMQSLISPNQTKIAISLYSEEYKDGKAGKEFVRSLSYLLVIDFTKKEKLVFNNELPNIDHLEWNNDYSLNIGDQVIKIPDSVNRIDINQTIHYV